MTKTYTADDFLRSVREARIETRRCEYRLEELRAQCERTTASYGGLAPGGAGDDHKDALLVAAAEQTEELHRRTLCYVRRIRAVEDFIASLPDVRQRTVLRLRYVDGLRWDAVREGMAEYGLNYEDRQVYRLHGAALAEARTRFPAWAEEHPETTPKEEDATT